MACNNGKKGFHSPYGMITDLNITYTGCSTTCNGEEIKPGMRLREILDILIGNCAEGGSATWGEIIGNIEDQTDLVQFIQDNTPDAVWGNITGNIEDQEDLVTFVEENGFTEDKVGTNLHLDGGGKVSLGVDVPGLTGVVITENGSDLVNYMILSEGEFNLVSSGGSVSISTQGINLVSTAPEGITVNSGARGVSYTTIPTSPIGGTLIYKEYVDDAISSLQAQIADLEARVQALEDATP